jgi:hypothetical protein
MTASVLWVWLALFTGSAAAFVPTPWVSSRAIMSLDKRSTCAIVMKKGRKQGGGPKIALKKTTTKTEGQKAIEKRVAEQARRAATRKKRPTIMYGRQRSRYLEQVDDGAERALVFLRARGEEEWLECGHVSIAKGSKLSLLDAAGYQKRLILEHGTRVHRRLQMQREMLECGIGPAIEPGADEAAAEGAVVTVERSEAAEPSKESLSAIATTFGFLGAPIPDAQKYWSDGTTDQVASDARKVNLNNALGNAAKSAVAVQTSKTLGLRSLG